MRPHVITARGALLTLRRRRKVVSRGMAYVVFALSFSACLGWVAIAIHERAN